jgi:hypothetical protein
MYDQTRTDQTPWRNTGGNALSQLSYLMGLQNPNAQNQEQIRASLLPQYTTQSQTQGQTPVYGPADPDNPWGARPIIGYAGSGFPGQDVVDETGLNAAIQQMLGSQQPQGADFGSLSKKFGMSDFNADPGYQFRMDQGINALQGRAAAGGGLKSGNTLKALMEYGQNLGSQEYGNAYNRFNNDQSTQFNRLSSMAGIGQTANSALQSAGTNYANSVGNLSMNNAANQGNAMLAGANARSSGYSAIGNALGNYFGGQQSNPGMASYDQNNVTTGFGYGEPLDWGW